VDFSSFGHKKTPERGVLLKDAINRFLLGFCPVGLYQFSDRNVPSQFFGQKPTKWAMPMPEIIVPVALCQPDEDILVPAILTYFYFFTRHCFFDLIV
jgi:hypothetical protein